MCGIAGIIPLDPTRTVARADLKAMADAIVHRGPDAEGIHCEPGAGFAFRRLSIIDRAGGDQPIYRGHAAIIFNGEVYNYLDLRGELEARGRTFATRSDTEVVLAGYQEWGARGMCERLRGMYAFAIHDPDARRVVLVRDRLGKKPLHLMRRRDDVLFGSELKALLAAGARPAGIDPRALLSYACLGYVPAPATIYAGVEKLPPAHFAVVEDGRVAIERYWSPPFGEFGGTFAEAVERSAELIREAVRIRLMSEVPLGAFLSGGVDSSLIVAAMVDEAGAGVKAVTVGFDDDEHDEREKARAVAKHLGISPHEEVLHPDPSILDALDFAFDEPNADPSCVPTYLLCRATRRSVTVALSGDGGDELFAGYRRYRFDLLENRVRDVVPAPVRRLVFGPIGRAWPKADGLPRPLRFKTTLMNLARDPVEAYFRSVARVLPETALQLLDPDARAALGGWTPLDRFREIDGEREFADPLMRIRWIDLHTWLPDDILAKVDRASMASSLEARAPLLDQEVVGFASSLPRQILLHGGESKAVLKRVAERRLPPAIMRMPKHGFDMPVKAWLDGPLAGDLDAMCAPDSDLAGCFDPARAKSLLAEHRAGRRDRSAELWMLLTFARWRRRWWSGACAS